MKIIGNIIPLVKVVFALPCLRKYKKQILYFRNLGDDEREREFLLCATSHWGKRLVKDFNVKLNVVGRENLPENGPVVYVANHQGFFDIPVCCAVLDTVQLGFIAKKNLAKIPLYGEWIYNIRSIMMNRDNARASLRAMDEAVSLINRGFSMLIFPEGTRSKGKDIAEFKKGSLRLATKPKIPVIPITINGTWRIFEERGKVVSGVTVDFIIHKPIKTENMDRHDAVNLAETVEKIIRSSYNLL